MPWPVSEADADDPTRTRPHARRGSNSARPTHAPDTTQMTDDTTRPETDHTATDDETTERER